MQQVSSKHMQEETTKKEWNKRGGNRWRERERERERHTERQRDRVRAKEIIR